LSRVMQGKYFRASLFLLALISSLVLGWMCTRHLFLVLLGVAGAAVLLILMSVRQEVVIVCALAVSFALTLYSYTIWAASANWLRYAGVSWAIFGGVPVLLLALLRVLMERSKRVQTGSHHWTMMLVYAIPVWSLVLSPFALDPWRSARYGVWILVSYLVLDQFVTLVGRRLAFVVALWAFAVIAGVFVVVSLLGGLQVSSIGFSGIFKDYDTLGMACIVAFISSLSLLYLGVPSRATGVFLIALAVASAVVGFFTLSRTTWLAVSICVVLYGWLTVRRLRSRRTARGYALIVTLVLVFLPLVGDIAGYNIPYLIALRSEQAQAQLRGEAGGRLVLWRGDLEFVKRYPIQGAGLTSSHTAVSMTQYSYPFGTSTGAHNLLIETLVERGFPGLVLFVAVLVAALAGIRRLAPDLRNAWWIVMLPLFTAMMFYSQTSLPHSPLYWVFWTFLAVAMQSFSACSQGDSERNVQ
jgi:hypothetical protein